MIKEIQGNLVESQADVLAHQVNCKGVMGAGVAKTIRNELLTKEQYYSYQKVCRKVKAADLLGNNQYFKVCQGEKYICNMFAENIPTGKYLDTDYNALRKCLEALHFYAKVNGFAVAIPGYLGCGLAGGDWDYVYSQIIVPIFRDSEVMLQIVYFPDAVEKLTKSYLCVPKENGRIMKD